LASPSQRTDFFMTQGRQESAIPDSTPRRPLRTLSLLGDLDTPDYAPRGRLRRRGSPITEDFNRRSSPSPRPSDGKLNAFDILTHQARLQAKESKTRAKLGPSEFVEAEAQESDDDEMRGFGISTKKDDEEEEDGEDLDKTLEVLVDDAEMDEETQAKEKVLEKVKSVNFS
jgi:mediator of replication checkpoint protein 1